MRATCEFAESKDEQTLPPIKLKIFKTKHDITIKISDLGGGIPRESSGKVFNYMYSTAPKVQGTNIIVNALWFTFVILGKHFREWRLIWRWTLLWEPSDARPRLRSAPVSAVRAVFQRRPPDRECGRSRDQCVCLPPEALPPGPGEHPRVQREVQRQAQERRHSGRGLDRWQEVLDVK